MYFCTKLNVKNAAPPAIHAIQKSEAVPPNINKKKPQATNDAMIFIKMNIVMMPFLGELIQF